MRKLSSRLAALLLSALTLATGVTCADSSTGPKNGLTALVGVAPVFSEAATDIYRNLVSLEFAIDNIHVVLKHANGDIAIDTVVTLAAGQEEVVLELKVSVAGTQEQLEATIELRDGDQVLFAGTQIITARAGVASPPTSTIELEYAGPGSTVTTLDVLPDTTISGVDDITMRTVGRDANNQIVTTLPLTWSVAGTNAAAIGSVTQAGVFQPTGASGTVQVVAELPTGVQGSATVTVAPPATSVVLISGGNQTAPAGATLELPIVVEVRSADGGPVAGHSVTFAIVTGGGSIGPPTAVTGANGRASATLTLGTSAGPNSVRVTATGLTPIFVSATGAPGAATRIAILQQPSASTVSGELIPTQPQVQLQDNFGNGVSTANVAITAALSPVSGRTLQGTATRNTNSSGVAAFTDLRISGAAGSTALQFSGTGLNSVTSQGIAVTVGGAAPVSWTNAAGGNWSVGANWSSGVAPTSTDNVVIDLAGTYTVTLDVNTSVAGLTLGGSNGSQTLVGAGRTLGVNGAMNITEQGALTLTASSSLAVAGTVNNQGTITLTNSTTFATTTLNNQATLVLGGTTLINGPLITSASSVVRVQGSSAGSHAAVTISNGFTNNGLVELTSIDGGFSALLTVPAGTVVNASTATITSAVGAGGVRTLAAQINNQGTVLVEQPLTLSKADADHVNDGTIDLTGGNLTVGLSGTTPTFSNNGAIAVGTNMILTFTGGDVVLQPGVVSGGANARLIVTGSTLDFTPASITVPITMTTTTIAAGSIAIATGQTLALRDGGVGDPITIQSGGTLLTHGTVTLSGPVTLPAGGTLRVRGQSNGSHATLTIADGLSNDGLIELTSADGGFSSTLTCTNGALNNLVNGTIHSAVGAGGMRTLACQLDNHGTLDVDQELTLSKPDGEHANSGTIDLTTANLTVTQTGATPFLNTGAITLGVSRTLALTGGSVDLAAGTVSGPPSAALVVTGATLAFTTTTVTVPMTLTTTTIAGGSVTIPDGRTLTLLNGGLNDPVTIESGGTLLTHGIVALNGTVTLPTGGTIRVRGQSIGSHASLTIADGFANNGLIELTSADGGFSSMLAVTNGTLANTLNGTIHSAVGAGGARTLAVQLDNQGTLDVDQVLTLAKADAAHLNSGTIDLATADLTVTLSGTGPSFVNTGGISLGVTRSLTLSGGTVDLSAGTVTGPPSATLFVSNATLAFTTTTVTVPMTLTATAIQGGAVTIPDGRTLTLLNGGLSDPVTIESGGTLLTLGAVGLTGTVTLPNGGTLRVRGQSIGSHATLTVANGFSNQGLIELTSADGGFSSTLAVTTGALANAGGATIHSAVGAGGARTLAARLSNTGVVDVDQALTIDKPDAHHYNSNFIDLTNADLTVTQSGTTPSFGNGLIGNITLGAGRRFTVNGGSLNLIGGSIIQGTPTSTLVVSGAVMDFTPPRVTIPMTLNSTTILAGSVPINSGEIVTLLNGGLSDPVTIESGGIMVTLGVVTLSGALAIPSENSTLTVQGQSNGSHATLTVVNGFTNSGLIDLTSADGGFSSTFAVTNGTLTNNGQIRTSPGAGGARTLAAELTNVSTLFILQPLTLDKASATHANPGFVDLTSASMTVSQSGTGSFTNSGTISLGASQHLFVSGGTASFTAGTVSGLLSSSLAVNGATMAFTTNHVSVPMTLTNTTISGGSVLVEDGDVLTLLAGSLNATVTVEGGGELVIHGDASVTSIANVESSGLIRVQGQSNGSHASLTVANGFTNHGNIELTSIDGGFSSTLAVTSGTLTNAGVIFALANGFGGARVLAAQLSNQGTLYMDQALTLARASAQHTNSGLFELHADMTVTQSGTSPSFTNSGTITLDGNTLAVTGGPFVNNLADAMAIIGPGTLNVGTNFSNNGSVRPDGTLNVTGAYPQVNPSGNLSIQISPSGGSSCAVSDQLVATGAASLAGGLNVFLNDCVLTNNQVFTILTAASVTGTFDYTPISIQGGELRVEYTGTQALLRFVIP